MISPEQLEQWAKLYDLGHRNFDGLSESAENARAELNRQLKEAHKQLIPSVPFREFRHKVIEKILPLLKTPRPTT